MQLCLPGRGMIATMAWSIVVAAAAAAAVSALAVWVLARRTFGRAAEAKVAQSVTTLTARVDELADELQRTLERAERRGARGELSNSIELEVVVAHLLEAATSLPGVDAAVVSLEGYDEHPLVAAVGMPHDEAERETLAATDGNRARAARPLAGELGKLGFVAVYSDEGGLEDDLGADLDELARRAGPAVDNALRYREARRLADHDALTNLHNRRFFHETLQRECARAKRYDRRLTLLVLDVDDFKAINERLGHLAGDGVLAEAAARLQAVLRGSDIACRVGGDEFAVILPEAGVEDAQQLYVRIEAAVSERPIGRVEGLSLSAGIAQLHEGDDAKALFERADDALYRAKYGGKARVVPAVPPEELGERPASA
jgi:diguanylate cyclase (GGDEF)-like protein